MNIQDAVRVLEGQGLNIRVSEDVAGPRLSVTNSHGEAYILRIPQIVQLERRGGLTLAGIKAMFNAIKNYPTKSKKSCTCGLLGITRLFFFGVSCLPGVLSVFSTGDLIPNPTSAFVNLPEE